MCLPKVAQIRDLCDIIFLVKFNVEFPRQAMDFPIEDAIVMLTRNIDIADRLINGQLGRTVRIAVDRDTNKVTTLFVTFDDDKAGCVALTQFMLNKTRAVPIVPILSRIKIRKDKMYNFPSLYWACTVHKVQGLTLENIVVSFELFKQRSFNYGQIYVALSRAKRLAGVHILGDIDSKH